MPASRSSEGMINPPHWVETAPSGVDGSIGVLSLEDVVITAATWFGSNGLGAGGLVGFMAMAARNYPKEFKVLFKWTAKRRMRAEDVAERRLANVRQAWEEVFRARGIEPSIEDEPSRAEHPEEPGPDEWRADVVHSPEDAIIAGAARHGGDGFGAGGLIGYCTMLACTDERTFVSLVGFRLDLELKPLAKATGGGPGRRTAARSQRKPDLY
jgi:hypothetical protein